MVDVDRAFVFGFENTVPPPGFEVLGCSIVDRLIFHQVVASIENQANDVVIIAIVKRGLELGVDDIVGWGDDVRERSYFAQVIPKSTKRLNICHWNACCRLSG